MVHREIPPAAQGTPRTGLPIRAAELRSEEVTEGKKNKKSLETLRKPLRNQEGLDGRIASRERGCAIYQFLPNLERIVKIPTYIALR